MDGDKKNIIVIIIIIIVIIITIIMVIIFIFISEITGITTMDGDKKNIDGEVFNNPFQLPAARNGG